MKYANRKLWNDFGGNPLQYRKPALSALAESPTHCPNDLSSKTHPIPSNFCCIANRFVPATLKVNFTIIHLLLLHHDPMIRRMRISGFHFVRGRSNGNCSIVRLDQRTETRRSGKLSRMVTGRFRLFFLLVFVLKDIAAEFQTDISNVTIAILLTLAMRPIGAFIFGRAADRSAPSAVAFSSVRCQNASGDGDASSLRLSSRCR